ncbi:MAG: beta-lactamase family protein [bacterium]|nr:beta-lactamase family protein [bacterium]
MNRKHILSIIALYFLIAGLCWAGNHSAADAAMETLHKLNTVPGMAAAIVKDGKLVWHKEMGYEDVAAGKKVSRDTRFRLASVSKFVTTAILAELVEKGKIRLDTDIRDYLPSYPRKKYPFTSRQLASHTAGISHYQAQDFNLGSKHYNTVVEGLDIFKDRVLLFEPGTKFQYSSFGFNLLSAVMEGAAKKDFVRQLKDFVKKTGTPLITIENDVKNLEDLSKLYNFVASKAIHIPRDDISYKWSGGGLIASAGDLALFGGAVLSGKIISPKTFESFAKPVRLANGKEIQNRRYVMGTGWRISKDHAGRRFIHHSGSMPGGSSHISLYPKENLVVTLLSNSRWVSAMDITTTGLLDAFLSKPGNNPCKSGRFKYKGTYRGKPIEGELQLSVKDNRCTGVFHADNALGDWLGSFQGKEKDNFPLIHVDSDGDGDKNKGTGNFILATPIGLYPVSLRQDGMTVLAGGTKVVLQFITGDD